MSSHSSLSQKNPSLCPTFPPATTTLFSPSLPNPFIVASSHACLSVITPQSLTSALWNGPSLKSTMTEGQWSVLIVLGCWAAKFSLDFLDTAPSWFFSSIVRCLFPVLIIVLFLFLLCFGGSFSCAHSISFSFPQDSWPPSTVYFSHKQVEGVPWMEIKGQVPALSEKLPWLSRGNIHQGGNAKEPEQQPPSSGTHNGTISCLYAAVVSTS